MTWVYSRLVPMFALWPGNTRSPYAPPGTNSGQTGSMDPCLAKRCTVQYWGSYRIILDEEPLLNMPYSVLYPYSLRNREYEVYGTQASGYHKVALLISSRFAVYYFAAYVVVEVKHTRYCDPDRYIAFTVVKARMANLVRLPFQQLRSDPFLFFVVRAYGSWRRHSSEV